MGTELSFVELNKIRMTTFFGLTKLTEKLEKANTKKQNKNEINPTSILIKTKDICDNISINLYQINTIILHSIQNPL